LSIRIGHFLDVKVRTEEPGPQVGIGLLNGVKLLISIIRGAIEEELDCERTWEEYV